MLTLKELRVAAGDNVVGPVSAEVRDGEVLFLTGKNGAGKTSLLRAIAGLGEVFSGKIFIDGIDVTSDSPEDRFSSGVMLAHQVIPKVPVSISKIVLSSAIASGRIEPDEAIERLDAATEKLFGTKSYTERSLDSGLSGGETKKLEMAQVYALLPRVALLDEIDSGVDQKSQGVLASLVSDIAKDGAAVILVSHSPAFMKLVMSKHSETRKLEL